MSEKIPHPNSTNKPHWACSCYFLLYNPAKQQKRALFGVFLLFGSSQTSPKQQHEPCWLVLLLVAARHQPRSKNVSMLVHFCCLSAGSPPKQQKRTDAGTFLLFVSPGFLPNSRTYPFGTFCCFFHCPSTQTAKRATLG